MRVIIGLVAFLLMSSVSAAEYFEYNGNGDSVAISGSFNNWDPEGVPLTRVDLVTWVGEIEIERPFEYKFLVDGVWTHVWGPGQATVPDGWGGFNNHRPLEQDAEPFEEALESALESAKEMPIEDKLAWAQLARAQGKLDLRLKYLHAAADTDTPGGRQAWHEIAKAAIYESNEPLVAREIYHKLLETTNEPRERCAIYYLLVQTTGQDKDASNAVQYLDLAQSCTTWDASDPQQANFLCDVSRMKWRLLEGQGLPTEKAKQEYERRARTLGNKHHRGLVEQKERRERGAHSDPIIRPDIQSITRKR